MLNPTAEEGRVWTSSWDNGRAREFTSGKRDKCDSEFMARGSGTIVKIDGNGIARLSGTQPRMYVYEEGRTWDNVEVTFYAKRIREFANSCAKGFTLGARSEHQAATDVPCLGFAYYGRMLYDGHINFLKELAHPPATMFFSKPLSCRRPIRRSLRTFSIGRLSSHNHFHQSSLSRGRWKLNGACYPFDE